MATKTKATLISSLPKSPLSMIIFALLFAAFGYTVRALTHAASQSYTTNITFTASDGTWPTQLLDDPMSLALGRYLSNYGYSGSKTYGPLINLTGTASSLNGGRNADATVMCGQTEPVPHFEYDSISKQWAQAGNGNELMTTDTYRLINGSNNAKLNIFGAATSKIDKSKPIICWAQVYVTEKSGRKVTTSVPVTQKLILQPK